MSHHANDSFYDIIYIGEISFAVTVVEYLNGLAFTEFVGKTKIGHIGTAGRTVDGEEAKPGGWNIVKFTIGMS